MIRLSLSFFAGILFFQLLPALPPIWLAAIVGAPALSLLKLTRWPLALALGFCWAWWSAQTVLSKWVPEDLVGRDLVVTGVVDDLPQQAGQRQKFVFSVDSVTVPNDADTSWDWQGRARLTWRKPVQPVKAGERWTLRVRLYRPSGFRNPGGLDYERWLYANRLSATGYVLARGEHRHLSDSYGYQRVRESLRSTIDQMAPPATARALLKALVIGDRSGFDDTHWEVFRRTGTSHLVAISGLHLGLLAGLVLWLVNRFWRLSQGLCRWIPARLAAAILAILSALGYAMLAGLSLPTQRALVMIAAGGAAVLLRRNTSPPHILVIALVGVVGFDPTAVLSAGFWLSFGAVTVIFLVFSGERLRPALLPGLVRLQFAITLGLIPVMAVWGLPISPLGLLVNLLAVPWFSVVVVPLCLLATLLVLLVPGYGNEALPAVLLLLDQTWLALSSAAEAIPWTWRPSSPDPFFVVLALCGIMVILLPLSWRLRVLGLAMLLPLLFPHQHSVADGAVRLAVLDVGQGLSVVVQTVNHVMVYDLGPKFSSGFNTAEAVVLPYLAEQGISAVDRLVLSHDDLDHAGAWKRFLAGIPVGQIMSGQSAEMGDPVRACRAGDHWYWDRVRFEVLHPSGGAIAGSDNDQSCVIRIQHPRWRILLTGDITRKVESILVRENAEKLASELVVVPHHGSRTSSSQSFVRATGSELALVSAGYMNRYGFPDEQVAERWRRAGAQLLDTADSGSITIDIPAQGDPVVTRFRETARRYWHR